MNEDLKKNLDEINKLPGLKKGVQNLLKHYIKEVKEVVSL